MARFCVKGYSRVHNWISGSEGVTPNSSKAEDLLSLQNTWPPVTAQKGRGGGGEGGGCHNQDIGGGPYSNTISGEYLENCPLNPKPYHFLLASCKSLP